MAEDILTELQGSVSRLMYPANASAERQRQWIAGAVTTVLFALLFAEPFIALMDDWWNNPDAGHGLLLGPLSVAMAWNSGVDPKAKPNPVAGLAILFFAVLVRYAAGLAAELFTMRGSMIIGLVGLTVFHAGIVQVIRWWLPFTVAALSIPLPELITQKLAFPMQLQASRMGGALLKTRGIPVQISGNIIRLPQRELFVTEACSGLRSLTSLLAIAVLGTTVLRTVLGRVTLVAAAFPIAILVNGVRVFMTGFLVFFVSEKFGDDFMHKSEGLLLFIVSLSVLGGVTWLLLAIENRVHLWRHPPPPREPDSDEMTLDTEAPFEEATDE